MFAEKFKKNLVSALLESGFHTAKNFQLKTIPKINGGLDVIGIGPEGCGKSSTIVMSAIHKLSHDFEEAPRALILVADKEKAVAMKEQFSLLAANTDLRIACVFEEGKIDDQNADIYNGTDIVIGTPKRISEIYLGRNLNLNKLKFFAIDDAELMIKNSYQGAIDRIGLSLPKCQHLVFTNDYSDKVKKLIAKFIVAPQIIEVAG